MQDNFIRAEYKVKKDSDISNFKPLISVTQKPIVEFSGIQKKGLEVVASIESLGICDIDAHESERKNLTEMKRKLSGELSAFENQRKMAHGIISKPYTELKDSYEEFIKTPYSNAIKEVGDKLSVINSAAIEGKKREVNAYFLDRADELSSFLSLESIKGLRISRTATNKSLFAKVDEFIGRVRSDIFTINKLDNSVRIMSLYESTLDLNGSIERVSCDIKREASILARMSTNNCSGDGENLEENKQGAAENSSDVFETSFNVKAKYEDLVALKKFMLDNGIEIV